jgi:ATP-dependent Clp protease protease subunit
MNRLMKLYALNKPNAARRFEVKSLMADGEDCEGEETTIYLYDIIVGDDMTAECFGGISPSMFIHELNEITAPVIHIRINSPGGDVFAARVMELAIRQHTSKIIAHVDGYAASAASLIAVACDETEIAPGGFIMIHKAWSICWGNSDDMTKTATLLGKVDETLVNTYVEASGQSADQVRAWMADETWFTGAEAVEFGFADRLAEGVEKVTAAWDMSAYDKAPKAVAPAPIPTPEEPAAPQVNDEKFLNEEHRERQQQRMNVLARARIG